MKSFILIFLLCVSLLACHSSTQKESKKNIIKNDTLQKYDSAKGKCKPDLLGDDEVGSPFDTIALLTKLFNPDTIIHGIAIWKPDEDATYNMNMSDDGNCHTDIDSILKIQEVKETDYLIVFTTCNFNDAGEISDCHSCGANYGMALISPHKFSTGEIINSTDSSTKNSTYYIKYHIDYFNRNFATVGCWGGTGEVSLEYFGEYVLHISAGYTGCGADFSYESYYDISNSQLVFTYESSTTTAAYDIDQDGYEETNKTMELLSPPQYRDWNDIKLKCTHRYYNKSKHRLITSSYNEFYRMNDEYSNAYERIK